MNTHIDNDYEQVVSRLILESPQVKITSVASDMLLSDIRVDSLEKLSIAMDLEEAYDIEISDDDVEQFTSVSDIVGYVKLAVAERKEKTQLIADSETSDPTEASEKQAKQSVDNDSADTSESADAV